MPSPAFSVRIGSTGKAELRSDFAEIRQDGVGTQDQIAAAAEAGAKRAVNAYNKATDDMVAADRRRAANADKLALFSSSPSAARLIGVDLAGKSAQESASAFRELENEEARLDARARALTAVLDPLSVAQARFNQRLGEARALYETGRISIEQLGQAESLYKSELDQATAAQQRHAGASGAMRAGLAQVSFQAQDVAQGIALGVPPMTIFAQQAGQVTGGLVLLAQGMQRTGEAAEAGFKAKMLTAAEFLGGPWGIAITTGLVVLTPFVAKLFEGEDAGKAAARGMDAAAAAADRLANAQRNARAGAAQTDVMVLGQARQTALADLLNVQRELSLLPTDAPRARGSGLRAGEYDIRKRLAEAQRTLKTANADYDSAIFNLKVEAVNHPGAGAGGTATADAQAKLAAADNEIQRAEAQLALTRAQGRAELKAGTITQAQYTAKVAEAQNAVDAARAATRAHAQGVRDAAKETRDAAKAQKELETTLTSIVGKFDPARAAATAYAHTLKDIDALERAGKISGADALGYRLAASSAEWKRQQEDAETRFKAMFGGDDPLKEALATLDAANDHDFDMRLRAEEALQQRRADHVRGLAGLYSSVFEGGSGSIWQSFKRLGVQTIAELAAQWRAAQIGGSSGLLGKLGGLLGFAGGLSPAAVRATSPAGSGYFPGNASGSEYWSGGATWLAENGPELVTLPTGSRITPAAETRRLLANDNLPIQVNVMVSEGQLFEARVASISGGQIAAAAPGIAAGGGRMGQRFAAQADRYSLRGR